MSKLNLEMLKLQQLAGEASGSLTDLWRALEGLSPLVEALEDIAQSGILDEDPAIQHLLDLQSLIDDVWAGVEAAEAVWSIIEDNKKCE